MSDYFDTYILGKIHLLPWSEDPIPMELWLEVKECKQVTYSQISDEIDFKKKRVEVTPHKYH